MARMPKWTDDDNMTALAEGWMLESGGEIQRIDAPENGLASPAFEYDEAARRWVKYRAVMVGEKTSIYARALAYVARAAVTKKR